jgi:hypothetical protein
MKTILLSTALFLVAFHVATAQQLTAKAYVEKTNLNLKNGMGVGFNFANDAEVGGFYQESAGFGNMEQQPLSTFVEQEFYGIYGAYPLMNRRVVDVKYQVRTGVSNGQNFVITSSILTDVMVMNRIKVGAGVGSRNFRPTLQSSISIAL